VGRLSADILAEIRDTGEPVIIENQIYASNHGHFGQVLTYSAHYDARVIVWIATSFRQEYRTAIAWLNSMSDRRFFAIELAGDGRSVPRLQVVAGTAQALQRADSTGLHIIQLEKSRDANGGDQRGAFVRAPFAVPSDPTTSPGQLALNDMFERIALLLAPSTVFPDLRKQLGDRNYYAFARGPVRASEWSIVFANSEVRLELVFNDRATAVRDLERIKAHSHTLEEKVGFPLEFDLHAGRAKQKVILRRAVSFQEREEHPDRVAALCVETISALATALRDLQVLG